MSKPVNISDEAVDAAVEALVGSTLGDRHGINGEEFVEAARSALEAAAPYLMAEAWEEGYEAADYDAPHSLKTDNPYRSAGVGE